MLKICDFIKLIVLNKKMEDFKKKSSILYLKILATLI